MWNIKFILYNVAAILIIFFLDCHDWKFHMIFLCFFILSGFFWLGYKLCPPYYNICLSDLLIWLVPIPVGNMDVLIILIERNYPEA